MAKPALPEIRESDAVGETAALYDDIRAVIGVPIVNLLFRHMATVPGCLLWAWGTIRPLYIDEEIPKAARALTADVMPGQSADLRSPIAVAHLSRADVAEINRVLDTYGRANPMNLIGLKIIDLALDGELQNANIGRTPPLSEGDFKRPSDLKDLLPMTDPLSAKPRTQAALNNLARQIHGGDTGVIPSLYRHFGAWPEFLDALEPALAPTLAGGGFEASAQAMLSASEATALKLYRDLPLQDLAPPDASATNALKGLIAQFPPNICRMTVLATLLRRGLPDANETLT